MTSFRPELLDELLGGAKTQEEFFGPQGVLKRLTGALLERALKAELEVHLREQKPSPIVTTGRAKRRYNQLDEGRVRQHFGL